MLILTRRKNQSIMLYTSDGPIRILLANVEGKAAKVGIEAPRNVRIVRTELQDKKDDSITN